VEMKGKCEGNPESISLSLVSCFRWSNIISDLTSTHLPKHRFVTIVVSLAPSNPFFTCTSKDLFILYAAVDVAPLTCQSSCFMPAL